MNEAIRRAIIDGSPGISVTCLASDLREIIFAMARAEREQAAAAEKARSEKATLTRREVMERLGVSPTTLHRWKNEGYLVPVKVGVKCLYKASDVEALLTKKAV